MNSNDVYINPSNGHLIVINNGNVIDTGIIPNTNCCFPQKVNDIYFGNTTVLLTTCRGRCGDTAVDSINGNVYRFNGYVWTYIGNLMGPTGYTGATGPTGYGISISSSYINTNGDLIFEYTDGTIVNAGYVLGNTGPTGSTGSTGATGVMIENASINSSGNLLLELSNSTEIDAGYVLGPTGVSITTGTINTTGNLILDFSNGDEQDVGYILGTTGPTGVGIVSGVVNNGELILYTSENIGLDVGYVMGPTGYTGIGITTGGIVNNNLLLYYTNGNIQTVGNVIGSTGPTGSANYTGTGIFGPGFPNNGTNTPDTLTINETISLLRQPNTYYPTQFGKGIMTGPNTAHPTSIILGNHSDATGAPNSAEYTISLGVNSGQYNQQTGAIAIGKLAGYSSQGIYSISIGDSAGVLSQADNSIIINASGIQLDNPTPNSCIIKPIRNANGSSSTQLFYDSTTSELFWGTVTPSSIRYKENIKHITDETIDKILQLTPVEFDYIENKRRGYGLIAEDTNTIMPELVCKNPSTNEIESVDYIHLITPLLKIIQRHEETLKSYKEILIRANLL